MKALLRRLMPGLALLAVSALAVAGCGSSSTGGSGSGGSGTMNLGVIYPFTGANADQGAIGMAGCLTGVAEVNAAGGALGRKVRLQVVRHQGRPRG
jgi:branched-chain amino acid transport system substrate-binding protein